MISPNSIQKLKERIDILDVISSYIPVKRMGSGYRCVCPFHDDHDPSMSISPERGMYHCFACKAGGDAIKFVMDYEKIGYPDALERLAQMFNFSLEYTKNAKEDISRLAQKHILPSLNSLYKAQLYKTANAIEYLRARGVQDSLIEKFELGWAGESAITFNQLRNDNIDPKDALAVGALKQNEQGLYPSFTNRITFPIYTANGYLAGFGGRTLRNDKSLAKYVNSPQSDIFDKSKLLYGYNLAKKEIYKKGQIIITEGYLDVIMLHQAGFTNAVAVLGTALTSKHLPLLKRENIQVVLCFDGDEAGQAAAFKSANLLSTNGIDASVVIISGGADPADMIAAKEIDKLSKILNTGIEAGEFYMQKLASEFDLSRPAQKQQCAMAISNFLSQLPSISASAYADIAGRLLGINAQSLLIKPKNTGQAQLINQAQISNNPIKQFQQKDLLEASILKSVLDNKALRNKLLEMNAKRYFKVYQDIFDAIIAGDMDNEIVRELAMSAEFKPLKGEESLNQAIAHLQIRHYQNQRNIVLKSNLNDPEVMIRLEKINKIIDKLNRYIKRIQ